MTVNTTQVSDDGGYLAISSENATLETALDEVINEMEDQGCPINQTQIAVCKDDTANVFAVVAIVKRH